MNLLLSYAENTSADNQQTIWDRCDSIRLNHLSHDFSSFSDHSGITKLSIFVFFEAQIRFDKWISLKRNEQIKSQWTGEKKANHKTIMCQLSVITFILLCGKEKRSVYATNIHISFIRSSVRLFIQSFIWFEVTNLLVSIRCVYVYIFYSIIQGKSCHFCRSNSFFIIHYIIISFC